MNWYKRLKLAQFGAGYGEHWIDETGNLLYADGEMGDMNHEAHVIEQCQRMIADNDVFEHGEFFDWDGFLLSIGQYILDTAKKSRRFGNVIERQTGQPLATLTPRDMVGHGFVETELVKVRGVDPKMLAIANGSGDPRVFGMKQWGWKRVMNNNIQTYTLTEKDVELIARGISNLDFEDENGDTEWNIESINPRRYYSGIPLKYIDMGLKGIQAWESGDVQNEQTPQPVLSQPQQQDMDAALQNWQNRTSD